MKKHIKRILIVILIFIPIFWYIIGYKGITLEKIYESNSTDIFNYIDNKENKDDNNQVKKDNNKNIELLLVNENNGLDKNYKPEGLARPNIEFTSEASNEERLVAGIIVEPLETLIDAAREDGIILLGNSAYRSYKSQKKVYNERVESKGKYLSDSYVAKPGYSEHQKGLCIDVTNEDKYLVQGTRESDWLEQNCYKFGFIIRYPEGKSDITGIEYEPWHIRYVGVEASSYIYNNGITLEEYLGEL